MNKSKVTAIIQARMGSTRLPNKAMLKLAGQSVLWHVINRVKKSKLIDDIIVATTTNKNDNAIAEFAKSENINLFRGSESDVLDRYYQSAKKYDAEIIARITADCPLIDPRVIDKVISFFLKGNFDYASNTVSPTYPDGLDAEVFTFDALKRAWGEAKTTVEREHVTSYLWNNPDKFRISNVTSAVDLSAMRWTLDEPRDWLFVKKIYSHLYNVKGIFYMKDILDLLRRKPSLQKINMGIQRNEGYFNSLKEDKMSTKPELKKSLALWKQAEKVIMNGTQLYSKMPTVSIKGVSPVYFVEGKGSRVIDLEGNEYIDYSMALGPCILGYADPEVTDAVKKQLGKGSIFSLPHPIEVEAAKTLCDIIPCAEMVRFLKTGSEATNAAVRIARAYTGREKLIKGHYHGWHEWSICDTPKNGGIPRALKNYVFSPNYNDYDAYEEIFRKHKGEIAAIIVEPVELESPKDKFLHRIKELAHKNKALLIFDEVVTGFRFGLGGAQKYFGVIPDLATFGKGMAGGLPLSCVVGRRKIMEGAKDKIFISTTFGGDILALTAFLTTVKVMKKYNVAKKIWGFGAELKEKTNQLLAKLGINHNVKCVGFPPRLGFEFKDNQGKDSKELKTLFMQEVVKRKVFFVWNILPSFAHNKKDMAETLEAFKASAQICRKALKENRLKDYLEGEMPITVV
jgi:glutamate-1-semialdehyde 2,1-aminomutase/spore coat polysaccharide biosynthesis protein SpsF